jgi:DNA-binding winged helix-turn-helix (wHTH) protein
MRVRFGDCIFDSETRELFRAGKPVHLAPKAFHLLELLIENRPRALSKEELLQQLWPKTYVSEGNLPGLVAEIRRAIGEGPEGTVLRTVYGYGYAFSAKTEKEKAEPPPAEGRYWLSWNETEIPLAKGENIIGRDSAANARIDDSTISRRHARIVIADKRASIEDLGSKNGTLLRGRKMNKPVELSDGDVITVGSVNVIFRAVLPATTTVTAHEPTTKTKAKTRARRARPA